MKKIEAIIRPESLNGIKSALEELGYPGMTVIDVKGHGKQKGIEQIWRGRAYKVEFLPKTKIEMVVLDKDVDKIIKTIMEVAHTGNIGDGKIFISTIDDAIKIRTGEKGEAAI